MKTKEKEIRNYMTKLGVSRQEAEALYAFDNDEVDNEVVNEIEDRIEANKVADQRSPLEKVKYQKAKKKKDAAKEEILKEAFGAIQSLEVVVLPEYIASNKMVFMDKSGNFYTMTLTKNRTQPDGYSGGLKEKDNEGKTIKTDN